MVSIDAMEETLGLSRYPYRTPHSHAIPTEEEKSFLPLGCLEPSPGGDTLSSLVYSHENYHYFDSYDEIRLRVIQKRFVKQAEEEIFSFFNSIDNMPQKNAIEYITMVQKLYGEVFEKDKYGTIILEDGKRKMKDWTNPDNLHKFFNMYRKLFYPYWLKKSVERVAEERKKQRKALEDQRRCVDEYGAITTSSADKGSKSCAEQPVMVAKGAGE